MIQNYILANVIHILMFGVAILLFVYAVSYRIKIMKKARNVNDFVPLEAKIRSFFFNVIFQQKLYKKPVRGIMHAFIFYGFIVYIFHTLSQMIAGNLWFFLRMQGVDPYFFSIVEYLDLGLPFQEATAIAAFLGIVASMVLTFLLYRKVTGYQNFDSEKEKTRQWILLSVLTLQLLLLLLVSTGSGVEVYESIVLHFSFLVLAGLFYFIYQRWILKRTGLDIPSPQSAIVIALIGTLMVSTILGLTAKAILENHSFSWITGMLIPVLKASGVDMPHEAMALYEFSWWLHIATVYVFLIYIPNSKHSHLLYAPFNFLFVKNRPRGAMEYMDIENSQTWGAANIIEFPWTTLLDSLACIECGRCTVECPAYRTGKPLNPKKVMVDIKHAMMDYAGTILKNGNQIQESRVLGEPYITEEEIWSCTSCYACVEACPVGNNQLEAILEMRRYLVLGESNFPSQLQLAFVNMEKNNNPWGIGAHTRADWAEGLGVKTLAEDSDVEVLYWAGCAASFDERNKKVARTIVRILQKAGVKFGILGTEENCSGDSARRGGNEYLYQMLATANVETLNRYGVKTIVTACPHCYNTLKNEYPQFGGNYEVYHHTEYFSKLIEEGRLHLNGNVEKEIQSLKITYHDSCYLGRYNSVYEEPRNLIKKVIPDLKEPADNRKNGLCCGAGGAQMWMEEKYERVNIKRTEQLLATGADAIGVACPFCMIMVTDGVKAKGLQDNVRVYDVSEILYHAIEQDKN